MFVVELWSCGEKVLSSESWVVGCEVVEFEFEPNSMKPSRFVGTTMSFFGSLTTPLFWSSRTSIISFFFLKNMSLKVNGGSKSFAFWIFVLRGYNSVIV